MLTVPGSPSLEQWEQRIRAALPAGVVLQRQGSQTDENRKMLSAFRWNLRILSYVALVVGAFLIFNTISVSVVRRRPEIGIVRALGASRGAVLMAFLGEAACFGVVGGIVGIALGRLMAIGAVRLLGCHGRQSLRQQYSGSHRSSRPGSCCLGLLVGLGVSLASAASPAREASLVSPVEAMARGEREYAARVHKIRDLWIALASGSCSRSGIVRAGHCGQTVLRICRRTPVHRRIGLRHSGAGQRTDGDFFRHAAPHRRRRGDARVAQPGIFSTANLGAGRRAFRPPSP